ncbi:hypothetical protein HJFPF1_00056 [Paramyrothecium foliicola]|nr:hypothetical protein HJFPF1_00056 [Paramyrothecium foliicola]
MTNENPFSGAKSTISSQEKASRGSSRDGIEVALYDGLEVAPYHPEKVVLPREDYPQACNYDRTDKETLTAASEPHVPTSGSRKRKRYIVPGAILIIVVIIISSVLGGVLGSKRSTSSSASEDATSTDPPQSGSQSSVAPPTPSETSRPISVAPNSPLAVTGLQSADQSEHRIYLNYRDANKSIKILKGSNVGNNVETVWEPYDQLVLPNEPSTDTVLAISSIPYYYGDTIMQFYLDTDLSFQWALMGDKPLQKVEYNTNGVQTVPHDSNFAMYGPLIMAPVPPRQVLLNPEQIIYPAWFNATGGVWLLMRMEAPLDLFKPNSKFAIVPLSQTYSGLSAGEFGFVFQDASGKLAVRSGGDDFDMGLTSPIVKKGKSLPPHSQFPNIELAPGCSFAALAVARSDDSSEDLVNTFILYQGNDTDIKQVWTEDGKEWNESSPEALKQADRGTDIACISLPAWVGDGDFDTSKIPPAYIEPLTIPPANHMARCYYQKDGFLIEARLEGTDWKVHGKVSLP